MRLNTQLRNKDKTVVFLLGPTASGKTELLKKIFFYCCEVVNADSVQVYRHLDICSAKADEQTRKIIPHYLIDIINPWETWNVKKFLNCADSSVSRIIEKGKIPVVCGGTAFYIKSFIYGLSEAPGSDSEIRKKVELFIRNEGNMKAWEYLKSFDPLSASKINVNDTFRLSRAIEVYKISGKALSSYSVPNLPRDNMNAILIGLKCEKEELRNKIRARVRLMFEQGILDEIKNLIEMGATLQWQSMQAIGYKEFLTYLYSKNIPYSMLSKTDLQYIEEQIVFNSFHYAKRQMTFLKSLKNINWFESSDTDSIRHFLYSCLPMYKWG